MGRKEAQQPSFSSILRRSGHMRLARSGPAVATATGLLLAMVAALAPRVEEGASGSSPTGIILPLPGWLMIASLAALAAASLLFIALLFPGPRRPRKQSEHEYEMAYEPRKAPLTVVLLLVIVALAPPGIFAASILWADRSEFLLYGRPASGPSQAAPALLTPAAPPPARAEGPTRPASPLTAGLLDTLAVLGGLGSLVLVLWLRFGDRLWRSPLDDERPRAQLAAAVEESLDDVRLEPDARTAIIKCYRRFENVVAAAELPRAPWQTPVEFMRAVLGRLPLPAAAVTRLTGLFEIARFSQHTVGPVERENARRSLAEIREALDRAKARADARPS
jgi:hypothetical protein